MAEASLLASSASSRTPGREEEAKKKWAASAENPRKKPQIYGPNSLNLSSGRFRADFKISSARWGWKIKDLKALEKPSRPTLTHYRRHFALHELRHRAANRYLEGRNVEGRHVILAATFVVVVNDVLSHIIVWSRILDVGLASATVHDEHEHQDCVRRKQNLR